MSRLLMSTRPLGCGEEAGWRAGAARGSGECSASRLRVEIDENACKCALLESGSLDQGLEVNSIAPNIAVVMLHWK